MPTLKDFGAFRVTMYAGDHNPPHFHIVSPDGEALVTIAGLEVIAGAVSARMLKRARDWAAANIETLEAKWAELSRTR